MWSVGNIFLQPCQLGSRLQRGSEAACPAERRDPRRPLRDARCCPTGSARAVLNSHTSRNVLQLCCRKAGVGVLPGGQAAVLPLVEKAFCSCVWILESFRSGGSGEGIYGQKISKRGWGAFPHVLKVTRSRVRSFWQHQPCSQVPSSWSFSTRIRKILKTTK